MTHSNIAPITYRDHLIHLDDEEGVFTVLRNGRLWAHDWPTLRTKIDTLEEYA